MPYWSTVSAPAWFEFALALDAFVNGSPEVLKIDATLRILGGHSTIASMLGMILWEGIVLRSSQLQRTLKGISWEVH